MSDFDHKIGSELRMLREAHGYTTEQIGELLGVSSQKVEAYETGIDRVRIDILSILKIHYKIAWSDLFTFVFPITSYAFSRLEEPQHPIFLRLRHLQDLAYVLFLAITELGEENDTF